MQGRDVEDWVGVVFVVVVVIVRVYIISVFVL